MRRVVLDLETTGLDPRNGDRIVEIGIVEISNSSITGKNYHEIVDPQRHIPEEVVKIHGINDLRVKGKSTFAEVADSILDFIGSSQIIIHNATFDVGFLNYQLTSLGKKNIDYNQVIDTLIIARKKFPGKRVNLNALCNLLNVDNSKRILHGALLDSQLLAEVYFKLVTQDQENLDFNVKKKLSYNKKQLSPRKFYINEKDKDNHEKFLKLIRKS